MEAQKKLSEALLDVVLYSERVESTNRLLVLTDTLISQIRVRMRLLGIVRATLPSALNVINASSVGKLVQLVTASRLTLYHEG